MNTIVINGRVIGAGHPAYIVAEMSANHDHDLDRARDLVRAAAAAGADAIKLQTYTADTLTIASDQPYFKITGTLWDGRTLHDLYREASTPWEWHAPLKDLATSLGLDFFSTPFDASAVDYLEALGVPAHKIASFEIVDIPLLRKVAATGKPVIMSTGMASEEEIGEAVTALRDAGNTSVALLKCTSAYPAEASDMHLATIPDLARRFGLPVGLSDHSMEVAVPAAAAALGACIIEKHFTLDRAHGGPDSAFSLEPAEFRAMVDAVRVAEQAIGTAKYGAGGREQGSLRFRRSLFVVEDVAEGERLTEANVRSIRPADGLHPRHLTEVLGRTAARPIRKGTPLAWELID